MILAGDIGGTKTYLALIDPTRADLQPSVVKSFPSREYTSLLEIVRLFLREQSASLRSAAFGIAGPVVNGRSRLTNLSWHVDVREVADELGVQTVGLLNDLEAIAYGTLHMGEKEKAVLQPGERRPGGAIAVIAAGTGLGEGGLFWDGRVYRAVPTEGGHTDFAPRDELEMELLRFLLSRFKRVSYERILSGPGLVNVYDFFRVRAGSPAPEWLQKAMEQEDRAAVISRSASEGRDQVCVDALRLFVSLYGAEAGNLALKFLSTGGVFVAGGIAPKIIPFMQHGEFLASFAAKGRQSPLLRNMPVEIILNPIIGIIGSAHYAQMLERESTR